MTIAPHLIRPKLTPLQCAQLRQLAAQRDIARRVLFAQILEAYFDEVEALDLTSAAGLGRQLAPVKRIWTQYFSANLTVDVFERMKRQASRLGLTHTNLCSAAVTHYFLKHEAPCPEQLEVELALDVEHERAIAYVGREQLAFGELARRCLKLGFDQAVAGHLPSLEMDALRVQDALAAAASNPTTRVRRDVWLPWALCEDLLAWAGRQNLEPERVIQRLFEHGFALLLKREQSQPKTA